MDKYINKVFIIGNLTKEPDYRVTANGAKVLSFSIAHNKNYKKGDEWETQTSFFNCSAFSARAETNKEKMHKGDRVLVEGELHWSSYETQDGGKREKVDITADRIVMIEAKDKAATGETYHYNNEFADIPF